MCGICGIIELNQQGERESSLKAMNQAIFHRGPDDDGNYSDSFCTLAMRRLSIIDLAHGKQPIYNENGDKLVFLNGEIYNFPELREELLKKGHVFKTNSDTETIIHLYEEFGENMLKYLKGMFAFCVYDLKEKKIFIARDRFGEKPLFYSYYPKKGLVFSSEIKSLLESNSVSRQLDYEALGYFLKIGFVPEPITLLKEVKALLPGHYMVYQNGELKISSYYEVNYKEDKTLTTNEQVIERLEPLMNQAVKRQSISDVPLGAFLSGGIDSSTVVAKLAENTGKKIKTFTVKFGEAKYDESVIAKKVSEYWDTEHTEIAIPNANFEEDIFWKIIDHVGMPFTDSSAIPTYFICKEIRGNVKVALSGDGGDEMFGGYDFFMWAQKIASLKKVGKIPLKLGAGVLNGLHDKPLFRSNSKVRQIRKALNFATEDLDDIPVALNRFFERDQVEGLMNSTYYSSLNFNSNSLLTNFPKGSENWPYLSKLMYYRLKNDLVFDMLTKVDRMSMAASLEVRSPFLDPDLADFSRTIPTSFLIKEGKGKYILREMMKNKLPDEVFNHPKMGFSIPLHSYQNDVFKKLAHSTMLNPSSDLGKLFNTQQLKNIIDLGLSRKEDKGDISVFKSSHQLWMMMQLFGWFERYKITL